MRRIISPELNQFECEVEDCPNEANFAVVVATQISMLEMGWCNMFICNDHVDWERDTIIASDRKVDR